MPEIWEESFKENNAMWGFEPSDSAVTAKNIFKEKGLNEILVPGFGYGRNAKVFFENGMNITGIEISKTAIELAKEHYGEDMKIYHGSVNDMPFDKKLYDGIFCYALIHLLNSRERKSLIKNCYNQLRPGGCMIFTVISKEAPTFETGKKLSKDRFEIHRGIKMFFYDCETVEREFSNYGLTSCAKIDEPVKHAQSKAPQKFLLIKCKK